MTFPSNFTPSDEEEAFSALEREAHMSDDALAMLLREARSQLDTERIAPIDEEREISEWLAARGVVVLPPAVAEVLRTGEPSQEMWDAAWLADDRLISKERLRWMLRAALAVLR